MSKIGDFFSFQNGYAFKSSNFTTDGKYKIIKIKELKDGAVKFFSDTAEINPDDEFDEDKYIVEKGDVLFALTGDPVSKPNPLSWVGRVSCYNHSQPALLNQRVCKAIPTSNVSRKFLYYFFRQEAEFYSLASKATGSASQANISTKTIEQHEIVLPDKETMDRIVVVLESLDNKIEINERINNNLLEQARIIFAQEFLLFDSLPAEWEESSLLGIANYLNGLAMQKYRPKSDEQGLPVLKIKELRQGFYDANSELCSPSIREEYIVHDGDVIFSWSGSLLVDLWCGGTCGLNQHLFKVTSNNYDKWFYYAWTNHYLQKFVAIATDKTTTMGHIKREELAKAKVLIPPHSEYERIGAILSSIYNLVIANRIENRKLATLRDELLPKLISGQIDVSKVLV